MLKGFFAFLGIVVVAAIAAIAGAIATVYFVASGTFVVAGTETVHGSGVLKTEERQIEKFTAIRLSGIGHLVIDGVGEEKFSITADDNLVPLFTSEVRNGVLNLSVKSGKTVIGKPTYHVTVGDLRELLISGSGTIDAKSLDGEALSVSISGVGNGNFAGRIDQLVVSVSGSGIINAAGLIAKRSKISVSGVGTATVNASDELDVRISGSGHLWYFGSPRITQSISGVGRIYQKAT